MADDQTTEVAETTEDTMDEFHSDKSLIKKFFCFLQLLDKWVYNMPESEGGPMVPVPIEHVDKLAIEFAKEMRKSRKS